MSRAGLLPPPGDFPEYEGVLDGAAEPIMRVAEEEQRIRRDFRRGFRRHKMAEVLPAGAAAIGLAVAAGIAAHREQPVIAIALGRVGLASLVVRLLLRERP